MRKKRYGAGPVSAGYCDPAKLIKSSPQTEILRHRDGGTADIIDVILYMDAHGHRWVNTGAVGCLQGADDLETLQNVWAFVRYNLRYLADKAGHERVKSPGALYASGYGDCKSFSIAEGAILRALGFDYRYRFTAYEPGADYTHVYVVATASDGSDVILDAVHEQFNQEAKYTKKRDIRPAHAAGIHGGPRPAIGRFPLLKIGLFTAFLIWLAK